MIPFIASLGTAFFVTLLVVWSSSIHVHLSGDTDHLQPQKFHALDVPRIGGVSILMGMLGGLSYHSQLDTPDFEDLVQLTGCATIAFAAGLMEDLTKRVTPRMRMLATLLAASAALWLVDGIIQRSGIPALDRLLQHDILPVGPLAMAVTLFVVAGVSNSVNIIDGFNGLASFCVTLILGALAWVAYRLGDALVLQGALLGLGAVLGFFVWNYPRGLIFMGDGGAYLLGFWIAELSILLVHRNPSVSPIFPLLVCAYPIVETLFSMYRRKVVRGRRMGAADAVHLHSLIYRRLMRWAVGRHDSASLLRRNSMTSPYLWALSALSITPGLLFWDNSAVLTGLIVAFCWTYIALYRSIVRFHTPHLLLRKTTPSALRTEAVHHSAG
ncbi:MAG: glycosyltransferase [Leptothrix ochracea]|uniref:MraY family glycosyltransferase n=1 Tax=Leptothrix ochracea TaxID=735331 RepID=UPI0034E233E3